MDYQFSKQQVYEVLSGKIKVRFGDTLQATASYLRRCQKTSSAFEKNKLFKKQEEKSLKAYAFTHSLWIQEVDFDKYISEGAEQRVYLESENHVLKLNDSIYYESWLDYFHNLILHNFFFDDTAYELIGFTENNGNLFAIIKQNYVKSSSVTNIDVLKQFLRSNGFQNTRNNDYFHPDLEIILEDLHVASRLIKGKG